MLDRDAFGRLGVIKTGHGDISTPTVLPVVNPFRETIAPSEIIGATGASALITNAFILYSKPEVRKRVLEVGVHEFLGVDCPIATDSGGYQIYRGQKVDVSPQAIHEFQARIGSDLAVVLDVPPRDDMSEGQTSTCIQESIRRSKELCSSKPAGPLWYGVVHLTPHTRLRREEAMQISGMPFDIFALGSCVGSLIEYRFESHLDRAVDTARRLPPDRPRHVFGVGHPMFLALSVAFGGDLFDSAMYALSAQEGRYLTANGTLRVKDLAEFPCSCPICSQASPDQMLAGDGGIRLLARHNLYTTFEELRRVRQAIRDNRLWELVQARCRSHPKLLGAFCNTLRRHRAFLEQVDPVAKKSAFFYSGPESKLRPEVTRARRQARRLPSALTFKHPLYGRVPYAASLCYPFGQTELTTQLEQLVERKEVQLTDVEIVKGAVDFQFGPGCGAALEPFRVVRSSKTGRIRKVTREGILLGTMRAKDFFFLPTMEGASILRSNLPYPAMRVVVSDDAAPFVSEGKSAFAKFVQDCDPSILPGQEVLIVDRTDRLLATGTSMMNSREMRSFKFGMAAKVRHHLDGDRP